MKQTTALAWAPLVTVARVEAARRELGLGLAATRREVHARYIALAKQWHPDKNPAAPAESRERFQRISQAHAFLQSYMRRYRYDLRRESILRDQETAGTRHRRQFGGGLYPGAPDETPEPGPDDPLTGTLAVTAENVEWARKTLGLLERVRAEEVEERFRAVVHYLSRPRPGRDADSAAREKLKAFRAVELLRRLLRNYRYSFRPEDVREFQEDWLQRHRRQFGNDPVWAGGTYHDNPDWTPYPNLDFEKRGPQPGETRPARPGHNGDQEQGGNEDGKCGGSL